ncbi:MAG: carbohydrate ABC transporter permease [Clostridia bacterium]|nr:carbohydrate ABC transporter permease [Clostridia bacterium]
MIETKKLHAKIQTGKGDKTYYVINFLILVFLTLIVVYPLYFLIIASFSDSNLVTSGEVLLIPKGITFEGYKRLIEDKTIWVGYLNTIFYTFFGTLFSLILTIPAGWGLSRPNIPYKKFLMWLFIIPMFFGGGLIPFYIVVSKLGMVNTRWALIIPSALSVWNVFMCKAYFESNLPAEILEAGRIDGAGELYLFVKFVMPLSKPIIAVIALYCAVGQWNNYFGALVFLTKSELFPLQLILRDILIMEDTSAVMGGGGGATFQEQVKLANQIKYTSIIVSSLPIILAYPFFQKYFNQGILVGSLKS